MVNNSDAPKIKLLVVDDDNAFREMLSRYFRSNDFIVTSLSSGEEALEVVKSARFDVGILDIFMPGLSGVKLLAEIKKYHPEFEAIILTGQASVDSAIESMKLGAYDYMTKPCKLSELELITRKAFEKKRLSEQNERLRQELKRRVSDQTLIGSSKVMENLKEQVERVSSLDSSVLLVGEIGAGKEVAAISLHRESKRKDEPFVTVHCGVLTEGMLETEIFGLEPDEFVGARRSKIGLIDFADEGAIFLEQVEQIPLSLQVKILHYLDTGEYRRVGGKIDLSADTRLIFGTTENLLSLTKKGSFREDLYYKISTFTINVPPLRKRKEDIPELVEYTVTNSRSASAHNKKFSKKALESLMEYNWPGNVRELNNVLERAASLTHKNVIQQKDLPLSFEKKSKNSKNRHLLSLHEIEREHILFVLDSVGGNISKASKILGVSRPKLYRKMEKYRSSPGL